MVFGFLWPPPPPPKRRIWVDPPPEESPFEHQIDFLGEGPLEVVSAIGSGITHTRIVQSSSSIRAEDDADACLLKRCILMVKPDFFDYAIGGNYDQEEDLKAASDAGEPSNSDNDTDGRGEDGSPEVVVAEANDDGQDNRQDEEENAEQGNDNQGNQSPPASGATAAASRDSSYYFSAERNYHKLVLLLRSYFAPVEEKEPRSHQSPALPVLRRLLLLHNRTSRASWVNTAAYSAAAFEYTPVDTGDWVSLGWRPRFRFGWSTGPRIGMKYYKLSCSLKGVLDARGEAEKRYVLQQKLRPKMDRLPDVLLRRVFKPEVLREIRLLEEFLDTVDGMPRCAYDCRCDDYDERAHDRGDPPPPFFARAAVSRRRCQAFFLSLMYACQVARDGGRDELLTERFERKRRFLRRRPRLLRDDCDRSPWPLNPFNVRPWNVVRTVATCVACGTKHDRGTVWMYVDKELVRHCPAEREVKVANGCAECPRFARPGGMLFRSDEEEFDVTRQMRPELPVKHVMACACGALHDLGYRTRRVPVGIRHLVRFMVELVCFKCIRCSDQNSTTEEPTPAVVVRVTQRDDDLDHRGEARGPYEEAWVESNFASVVALDNGAEYTGSAQAALDSPAHRVVPCVKMRLCLFCGHEWEKVDEPAGLIDDETGALRKIWIGRDNSGKNGCDLVLVEDSDIMYGGCHACAGDRLWVMPEIVVEYRGEPEVPVLGRWKERREEDIKREILREAGARYRAEIEGRAEGEPPALTMD